MKTKLGHTFRVLMALVILVSLGAIFALPAAAEDPDLKVIVNGWCKDIDTMEIHPWDDVACDCFEEGDPFYINASIIGQDTRCEDVTAYINVSGPAHLDPCDIPSKNVGNIESCTMADVWWKVVCEGPGKAVITVDAMIGTEIIATGITDVDQCDADPCPVLEVEIIECAGVECSGIAECEGTVEVSTVFAVKAIVRYADDDCNIPASPVSNVSATINIAPTSGELCEIPGEASLVTGMPESWTIGNMEPGDEHEVGWTLHCDSPGDVVVTVDATFDGMECDEVTADHCLVHQEVPGCIAVAILNPKPGEEKCATCDDFFDLDVELSNPCDVDVENVCLSLDVYEMLPGETEWTFRETVQDLATIDMADKDWGACCDILEAFECGNPLNIVDKHITGIECIAPGDVKFVVTATGRQVDTQLSVSDSAEVIFSQVPWQLDITTPTVNETFSTEQVFDVAATLKNCSIEERRDIDVALSWGTDPEASNHLGAVYYGGDPVVQEDLFHTNGLCSCCWEDFNWQLKCTTPGDLYIKVTSNHTCCEEVVDIVKVYQQLKTHLVAGLDTEVQCCPCDDIMEPIRTLGAPTPADLDWALPGQVFHVVAPVCNTGSAIAENVSVKLQVDGAGTNVTLLDGDNPQILGTILGGECAKAFWLVQCINEGPVRFTMIELNGTDINTGVEVLEDNKCWPCPLDINQVPIGIEFIQPDPCEEIAPCSYFTVKAKIENFSTEDMELTGVTAELQWKEGQNIEFHPDQPAIVPVTYPEATQ